MAKIIFVDDDRGVLTGYVKALEEAGHEVIFQDQVEEGKAAIYGNVDAACIVLDIMMPFPTEDGDPLAGLGGLKIYFEVIRDLVPRKTPVILLTSRDLNDVRRRIGDANLGESEQALTSTLLKAKTQQADLVSAVAQAISDAGDIDPRQSL